MIEKLNNVNVVNFTGKKNNAKNLPAKKQNEMSQQTMVVSKEGAKAIRNLFVALAATGAMTSCENDDPDFVFNHESDTHVQVTFRPQPVKPDTIHVVVPGKNDTIFVELPKDTVYMQPTYKSEVADSLIAHGKNLGFKFDGEGNIPVRINQFDQWNSTNHDMILDGKASSEEKMVFIDQAKDYSKDAENPEIRYNRVEFSIDRLRGVGTEIKKAPYVGVKPTSALEWRDAAKVCLTNMKNGFTTISKYDDNNVLFPIGNLEKSKEQDVDFYENLFVEDATDTYNWSEAKMTLANPAK